jgi:thiosulfate/3-mercaptopyruvate sulfurtransferase
VPANPDALATTEWAAEHLDDPNVVVADVDEDITAYSKSHIPGSVGFDWKADFHHPTRRTFLDKQGFEKLLSEKGISNDDHVLLYGGNNNWFAAYAYWYFKIYGHDKVSLIDGGRKKWEDEGRPLTDEVSKREATDYRATEADESIRARRDQILSSYVGAPGGTGLVDVRSPEEFRGEKLAPESAPQEAAQVGGHIPGAKNIGWGKAVNQETGEILPVEQLRELYASQGITGDKDIVAYCRIGERSAHSWFVLHEVLGYDRVRNYDGSWTEYGSLVDVPIEKG